MISATRSTRTPPAIISSVVSMRAFCTGPRERIVLVSDRPSARRSVLAPTAPHTGAILEEREQPDFGSDITLIVEDVGWTDLPRLEALLEGCAFAAHFDRAFSTLV